MNKKKDDKKGMNTAGGPMPNMQGPNANYSNDPRSPYYNVYGPGAQNNQTNPYYNNYGRPNPMGAQPQQGAANNNAQNNTQNNNSLLKEQEDKSDKKAKKKNALVSPDGKKLKGKDKKIAKKKRKFDDNDLRCYPMTAGKWIGTFIIMAIPLLNIICGICWLFGVGNKSRSAFVRAHLIIFLIIVLIIGIALGVGWSVMSKKASQEVGAESPAEVTYYIADQVISLIEPMMGKEVADGFRAQVAQMLGVKGPDLNQGGDGTEQGGELGGDSGDEFFESDGSQEEFE